MATDYLELNRKVLEELKESDPVKYRSLKRYLECQNIYAETGDWDQAAAHWNAWAENLLAERKKMEESGEWQAEKDILGRTVGKNQLTQDWLNAAKVDFSFVYFMQENDDEIEGEKYNIETGCSILEVKGILFGGIKFPFNAKFMGTKFIGISYFAKSEFFDEVTFQLSKFMSRSIFEDVIFKDNVIFGDSYFRKAIIFQNALFCKYVSFWDAIFNSDSSFWNAKFIGNANFQNTLFKGYSKFQDAKFCGNAIFQLAQFKQFVILNGAQFRQAADFSSIHSAMGFSLHRARFREAPDFNEAAFHAPPVLDDVKIEEELTEQKKLLSVKWPCRIDLHFKQVPNPEKNAKRISRNFRALGKMAHEARDWLNEMEFFAQEIRARRFGEDFPLGEYRLLRGLGAWLARKCRLRFLRPVVLKLRRKAKAGPFRGPNVGRFWFGLIYEKASNFGRSFARPLALWVVTTALFAALYAALASEWGAWNGCDALYLSVRHGLVVGGLVRTGHMQQVIEAMFGEMGSGLALLMMGQTLVSAFFLFLFFLAVRNHFRIR